MNVFKALAIILLSFLLFFFLPILAVALTLNSTVLNPDFIVAELDDFRFSAMIEEVLFEETLPEDLSEDFKLALEELQEELPEDARVILIDTITRLESVVDNQTGAIIYPVYDYLLGRSETLGLTQELSDTMPDFVASLVDNLDISVLAEEILLDEATQEDLPEEFKAMVQEIPEELRPAIVDAIAKAEPLVVEQVRAIAEPTFSYIFSESENLDLALVLNAAMPGFIVSLVENVDISSLVAGFSPEQLVGVIPEEMKDGLTGYVDDIFEDVITELEPWLEEQVSVAIYPLSDYLLGQSRSLDLVISLEPLLDSLEVALKEAFLESPPSELADLSPAELDPYFDDYFEGLTKDNIPSTMEINESLLGTEVSSEIAEALAEVEVGLSQLRQDFTEALSELEEPLALVRQYVGYFQLWFKVLIGIILLLVLGIILLNWQVRGAALSMGLTFLCFGLSWYVVVLIVKNFDFITFAQTRLGHFYMPDYLQMWLQQLTANVLSPVEILSLVLLITGAALVVVSFVYKREQSLEQGPLT